MGEIYAPAVHAGGGARLKAAQRKVKCLQGLRELRCREHSVGAALVGDVADIDASAEEGARRKDDRLRGEHGFQLCFQAPETVVGFRDFDNFRLPQVKIFLTLKRVLHPRGIGAAVNLCPQGMDSRPLAEVEHP